MKKIEVYKKNRKWCLRIGDKEFCEGDIVKRRFVIGKNDVLERTYELRFGCARIPDNEHYGDNFVVGFYLVKINDGMAWHIDDLIETLTGAEFECYNGWNGKIVKEVIR